MARITGLAAFGVAALVLAYTSTGADATKTVSEVDGFQSVRLAWRGKRTEPTLVRNAEELRSFMPSRIDAHAVGSKIDFKRRHLLIFAWEGDSQDRIHVKTQGNKVHFVHWGNTNRDDPHLHCRMYAIQQGVAYSAIIEPDPR